ncbi:uncharacterized protein LOC124712409 [Schistocerca piceifrons]|uniref:uncharacterized protein LOC124712409 n=1 Tax=Schistocerca piceifrons TaxID=274613 RepID=UPI001F5FED78|nr:uncharacterized protein LOC124712409 [Schistocerca piceifrons]
MEKYCGIVYELDVEGQQNMEQFLGALGVSDQLAIDFVLSAPCRVTLTSDGDEFTQQTSTCCYEDVVSYRLDECYEQQGYDGRLVCSLVTEPRPSTHLLQQTYEDGTSVTIEKRFSATELVMILKIGDVTARRTFRATTMSEGCSTSVLQQSAQSCPPDCILQADGA